MTYDLTDLKRGVLNREVDVFVMVAAAGVNAPIHAAFGLALRHRSGAKRAALALPNGVGQLLADCANKGIQKFTAREVMA